MENLTPSFARRSRAVLVMLLVVVLGVWLWLPTGVSLSGATPVDLVRVDTSDRVLGSTAVAIARTWISAVPAAELDWNWGPGVLVVGLERTHRLMHVPEIGNYVRAYLQAQFARGIDVRWSDDALPALAAVELTLQGEREFRPLVARVVDYSMHAPRTRSGMIMHLGRTRLPLVRAWLPETWVDSLFHIVPTLLRYSRLTNDPRYRDEAARQLRLFTSALMDPVSGLATHAYNDGTPPERVPAFAARAFWARGNGWLLATLVDALSELPETHPDRPQLLAASQQLAAALVRVQAPSGLFHTLLLRSDSYLETAGSALIVAALAQGIRLHVFPSSMRAAVERGASGLVASVRRSGSRALVTGTSLGTNPIAAFYAWTPTADQISYGVGAWLMAACEIVQMRAAQ